MSCNSPHHRVISYVQQRQRACSTLPSLPCGSPAFAAPGFMNHSDQNPPLPPMYAEKETLADSPYRIHLPLHTGIPYVVDPSTLLMAVQQDPQHMFDAIQQLVKDRDELRQAKATLRAENNALKVERNVLSVENKNLSENFDSARLDFRVARDKMEKMEQICALQSAKQVILWKFIERLENRQQGPVGEDGYWKDWNISPIGADSETSEPSSECSTWSTTGSKDSSETKLDPNAQAFVPLSASPPKSLDSNTPNELINITTEPLNQVIVTLPARFFGVCPNSISSPGPCSVPKCRLQPLCEDFNDEFGAGCKNRNCTFAHLYRTCTDMLDREGCSYINMKERDAKKDAHMKKRIHPMEGLTACHSDWKLREAIAGLREAHKERRY